MDGFTRNKFTKNKLTHKNIIRSILLKLNGKDFLNFNNVNKYIRSSTGKDFFIYAVRDSPLKKLRDSYTHMSWRKFYIYITEYIRLLKEKFNYDYKYGDPKIQFEIFQKWTRFMKRFPQRDRYYNLAVFSFVKGETALLDYCFILDPNVKRIVYSFIQTSIVNHDLKTFMYLLEKISTNNDIITIINICNSCGTKEMKDCLNNFLQKQRK